MKYLGTWSFVTNEGKEYENRETKYSFLDNDEELVRFMKSTAKDTKAYRVTELSEKDLEQIRDNVSKTQLEAEIQDHFNEINNLNQMIQTKMDLLNKNLSAPKPRPIHELKDQFRPFDNPLILDYFNSPEKYNGVQPKKSTIDMIRELNIKEGSNAVRFKGSEFNQLINTMGENIKKKINAAYGEAHDEPEVEKDTNEKDTDADHLRGKISSNPWFELLKAVIDVKTDEETNKSWAEALESEHQDIFSPLIMTHIKKRADAVIKAEENNEPVVGENLKCTNCDAPFKQIMISKVISPTGSYNTAFCTVCGTLMSDEHE